MAIRTLLAVALGLTPALASARLARAPIRPAPAPRTSLHGLAPLHFQTRSSLPAPLIPRTLALPSPREEIKAAPRNPAWDDARTVARRLGLGRGIVPEGHEFFHENIARYLYNAYPDEILAALARQDGPLTPEGLPLAPRWMDKILRDLGQPYGDDEVSAHIDRLQGELVEAVRLLREWSPSGGFTLTLMGGIVRGRLSARSDLDVILYADEALFERAMSSPFGYLVKSRFVILSPAAQNKRIGRLLGPKADIGDGSAALADPAFLRKLFEERRRGLALESLDREMPPEKLELFMELKKLSKKRLQFPPGHPRRLEIEERLRRLSKQLWRD